MTLSRHWQRWLGCASGGPLLRVWRPAIFASRLWGSASARLLPRPLRSFQADFPQIGITFFEGTDVEVAAWVRDGVADLGITTETLDRALVAEPYAQDVMLAVVPRGHRLASHRVAHAGNLATEAFLMSGGGCEPLIRAFFSEAGMAPIVAATVRDIPTLLAMTREGAGVTIVPESVLPDPMIGLRAVPLTPACRRQLMLVHRADHAPTPAAAACMDALRLKVGECRSGTGNPSPRLADMGE